MSGHSKWATIKHKKGAADAKRGKLFAKLIKQVEVAARQGGGDPDINPTLRTMFQKARDSSVPLDTIERAVTRGPGALAGVDYGSSTYAGPAPPPAPPPPGRPARDALRNVRRWRPSPPACACPPGLARKTSPPEPASAAAPRCATLAPPASGRCPRRAPASPPATPDP